MPLFSPIFFGLLSGIYLAVSEISKEEYSAKLKDYFDRSYQYVGSLKPKSTKKKD